VKLIAYQNGDRRVMARVVDDMALPFASLEDFWADPQQSLRAAAKARSGGEPVANLVQVPPLPDTARVICAGLNYAALAEEAHFKLPTKPDIFGRWRSTLAVDGQPVTVPPRDDHFDWEGELAVVIGKESETPHLKSPRPASSATRASMTSAPADSNSLATAGRSARTPTTQDRSARGSLRPTRSPTPVNCESRPASTATRSRRQHVRPHLFRRPDRGVRVGCDDAQARRPHRYRHARRNRGHPETTDVLAPRRRGRSRGRADRPHHHPNRSSEEISMTIEAATGGVFQLDVGRFSP
jgi:hypothetical protein